MRYPLKNLYLQTQLPNVDLQILDNSLKFANEQEVTFEFANDDERPDDIFAVPAKERFCAAWHPQAFGRRALVCLKRDLKNDDPEVVLRAIGTICDIIHDPEKVYAALRLNLTRRIGRLAAANDNDECTLEIREYALVALAIMATLDEGRRAIVNSEGILKTLLAGLLDDDVKIRAKSAVCVQNVANCCADAEPLIEHDFIDTILEAVTFENDLEERHDEITVVLLNILKLLMYHSSDGKNIVLQQSGFKTIMDILTHTKNPDIQVNCLDCLMLLTVLTEGKNLANELNLLDVLEKFLKHPNIELIQSAAAVSMFRTVRSNAKRLTDGILRLVSIIKNPLNPTLQMFSLQLYTNICENPSCRKQFKQKHYNDILNLQTRSDAGRKDNLLNTLNFRPYPV